MTMEEWRFSARLAWQDRSLKWTTICVSMCVVLMSAFLLWRLIPEGLRSGVVTMHYSIYLGIDDVRTWPWVFVFPVGMLSVFMVNTSIALGIYRNHVIAARALTAFTAVITILWGVGSFFITVMNL